MDKEGWNEVRDGLEVKIWEGPDGKEVFLLCRSEDRREKDAAMHERFSRRIVTGLESLRRRLEHAKKRADRVQVERQLGRLFERNRRAAKKCKVIVQEDSSGPSGLRVRWTEQVEWSDWARQTEGTYILRSNVADWSGEELWKTYIQLHHAEAAFRIQKSDLKVRPVWHQKAERVQAHVLVCFLAYAMWKTLEGWQKRAGLGASPRTILEELARVPSVDVVLPLETGREMRLRCVAQPERATAVLLARLGLRLPERLRAPQPVGRV